MLKISNILPVDITATIGTSDDSKGVYAGINAYHTERMVAVGTDRVAHY